jgi:hypothetical protein
MDQEKLVRDEIDAGANLIQRVNKTMPIEAAFWLFDANESQWFLYLASDQVPDAISTRDGYGHILAAYNEDPSLYLDLLQVKLISLKSPLAQEALARYERYPSTTVTRINGSSFGGLTISGGYLYPPTIVAPTPSPSPLPS